MKTKKNKRKEWTGAQIVKLRESAELSASKGDAANAIKYARKYNSIIKKTLGEHNPISYRADFWLAKKSAEWGNVKESLRICLKLVDEKLATQELYTFISELYFKLGNNIKAQEYQLDAFKTKELSDIWINNDIKYERYNSGDMSWYNLELFTLPLRDLDILTLAQCNMSIYEDALGNSNESVLYAKKAIKDVRNLIFNKLRSTASSYQSVEKYIQWYNTFLPTLAAKSNDAELISNAYEALVATKNIQLNTEVALKQLIMHSNDTTIINYYKTLEENRKAIQSLTMYPNEKSREIINTLVEYNTALEAALAQMSLVYGDYTKSLKIRVADIVSALHDNEVAIEFAIINGTAGPEYVALLLKRDSMTPILVKLCREADISSFKRMTNDELSDCLWNPIMPYLKGIDTVFFSPTGVLYSIGVEYLPIRKDGILLRFNEAYETFRVSSTREVVIARDKSRSPRSGSNTYVLYGGLNYDLDVTSMENDSRRYSSKNRGLDCSTNFKRTTRKSSLCGNLPGTKAEIENIANFLQGEKREVLKFEDDNGTESSFKSLSGMPINMIHIATHGFYFSKEDVEGADFGFINGISKSGTLDDADMLRSGLLFSGANQVFTGKDIPQGTDDGILTSLEIQSMNLCGVDLVVMSACQTGEGELNQDGVFGLQRGFKKAGVKSLLMSLRPVNDKATQILMEHFYKNLTSGKTKRESLLEAQKYLRAYAGGIYDKEEYWTAFILLDAIDIE